MYDVHVVMHKRVKYVPVYLEFSSFFLNGEVGCSRSAARSAGFAESPFVVLTEPSIWAKQQPVWAAILHLSAADLPAPRGVGVRVGPQVSAVLDLIVASLLPSGRVAAHLEEVYLLSGGGHFVLLCGHVL